jgi:hypothetical protein
MTMQREAILELKLVEEITELLARWSYMATDLLVSKVQAHSSLEALSSIFRTHRGLLYTVRDVAPLAATPPVASKSRYEKDRYLRILKRNGKRNAEMITAAEIGRDAETTVPRSLSELLNLPNEKDPGLKTGGRFRR